MRKIHCNGIAFQDNGQFFAERCSTLPKIVILKLTPGTNPMTILIYSYNASVVVG
jgi:hypothetical protein